MTTDQITAWGQLAVTVASIITAVSGAFISYLRYRMKMAMIDKGIAPDKLPELDGPGPVLLLILAGGLLAWLVTQNPRLALLRLPSADALAKAGPVDRVCNGSNDCGAGCSCDRGECKCAADRPTAPRPQRQKRRVALSEGTLCADCQALPWMITEIETFPTR